MYANLIKALDEGLKLDTGIPESMYVLLVAELSDEPQVIDILQEVKATDGYFYLPRWHPGIIKTLALPERHRSSFIEEQFRNREGY
jgi:hypothetical protein